MGENVSAKLEHMVSDTLIQLGCSPEVRGFPLLKQAICKVCEDPDRYRGNVFKGLYGELGDGERGANARVERNIRHCIELAFDTQSDVKDWYFGSRVGYETGRPTNAQFIFTVAERLGTGYGLS